MTHSLMKKLLVLAATISCLCSCIVDIDWEYEGYADIFNGTSQTIKLTITVLNYDNKYYPAQLSNPADGIIKAGETMRLYYLQSSFSLKNGDPASFINVTLEDGSEFTCSSGSGDSWSRRFFDSFETRKGVEWSHFQKHDIFVETYVIDDELIALWRQEHI